MKIWKAASAERQTSMAAREQHQAYNGGMHGVLNMEAVSGIIEAGVA